MLLDAFKSEAYRLSKNRSTLFWGLGFVPLVFMIGGSAIAWYIVSKTKAVKTSLSFTESAAASDLGAPFLTLVGQVSNIATLAFLLIAAATLFAGDYRWETWRLISARNSRFNLLAGKILTLLSLILLATVFLLAAGLVVLVVAALREGSPLGFSLSGSQWQELGLSYLLGIARLFQVLVIAMFAAILTRSLLAALFVPFAVNFAQFFFEKFSMFLQIEPTDWLAIFVSPGLAFSHLKAAIQGGLPPALANDLVAMSLGSVALWIAVPVVLSFVLFQRQGLHKE